MGGVQGGLVGADEGGVVHTKVVNGVSFRLTFGTGTLRAGTGPTAESTRIIKHITIRQIITIHTGNRRTGGGGSRGGRSLVRENHTRERHRFSENRHGEYRGTLYSTVYLELQRL